jgi:hypothetical protein
VPTENSLVAYPGPFGYRPSKAYRVAVNGEAVCVYPVWHPLPGNANGTQEVAAFAMFDFSGEVTVAVTPALCADTVTIRPARCQIALELTVGSGFETTFAFRLTRPENLYLEPVNTEEPLPPLYLFASPMEENVPDPNDPTVVSFAPGQVHDVGIIELREGQTLYIPGNTVVHGAVHALPGANIRVCGRGILDGSRWQHQAGPLMLFEGCTDLRVEGIATVGTPSWNLVLAACERATVRNVKLMGWVVSSDGIDIVGSRDIQVEDCFLRNNDDCIAVKAVNYRNRLYETVVDPRRDVDNVHIRNCVLYNDCAGNTMEIGYETQANFIRNITFRDIDVIAAHGYGGVFSIHNGDRATICDVLYENIRVEHYHDKFVDFRILDSRYSKDTERGQVRNITLRNIRAVADPYNCVSLIGGYDAAHTIENVAFENVTVGEKKVEGQNDLDLYTRHADNITFR